LSIGVSDVRSNLQDQLANVARVLGRSEDRKNVFRAIHAGKKRIKTITDLERLTGLRRIRVLQEAKVLANNHVVKGTRVGNELAYEKDAFCTANKDKILRLADDPRALSEFATKVTPKMTGSTEISIRLPREAVNVEQLSIDEIDSFVKVRNEPFAEKEFPVEEKAFKEGLQKVLGEQGIFQDWGGELDDLFSSRLVVKGQRRNAAFGLKGRGTRGILTPGKMGKNGDQIQRLFRAPADVYVLQFWGQIDQSVIEQMRAFAISKSASEGRMVHYAVIDGQDTNRLLRAYSEYFNEAQTPSAERVPTLASRGAGHSSGPDEQTAGADDQSR